MTRTKTNTLNSAEENKFQCEITGLRSTEQQPLLKGKTSTEGISSGEASSVATGFGIFKSIVGGAVLALPWAFSQAGWLSGICVQVVIVLVNFYTYIIVAYYAAEDGQNIVSFREICERAGGKALGIVYDILIVLLLSLALLAYIIFIGDSLMDFISYFNLPYIFTIRRLWITVIFAVVLLPLSLFDNLTALRYSSIVGVAAVIYVGILMIVFLFTERGDNEVIIRAEQSLSGICLFFGLTSAAYNAHFTAPNFYRELKNRSMKKFTCICGVSYLCIMLVNSVIGLSGYFLVGYGVTENVLNSIRSSVPSTFAYLAVGISVMGSYPIILQATRASYLSIIKLFVHKDRLCKRESLVATLILSVLFWLLGVTVDSVGIVLTMAQSIGGNAICYHLPAYIHWKRRRKDLTTFQAARLYLWCCLIGLLGLFGTVTSLAWVFENIS
jgi:amino acid permease